MRRCELCGARLAPSQSSVFRHERHTQSTKTLCVCMCVLCGARLAPSQSRAFRHERAAHTKYENIVCAYVCVVWQASSTKLEQSLPAQVSGAHRTVDAPKSACGVHCVLLEERPFCTMCGIREVVGIRTMCACACGPEQGSSDMGLCVTRSGPLSIPNFSLVYSVEARALSNTKPASAHPCVTASQGELQALGSANSLAVVLASPTSSLPSNAQDSARERG